MPRRPGCTNRIEPAPLPQVHLSRDYPDTVVAENMRSGRWLRASRGIFVDAIGARSETDFDREERLALARAVGVHRRLKADHWFSHTTAALLWGLPLWLPGSTTHILSPFRGGAERSSDLTIHTGPLDETGMLRTMPVTSLARTVADCLSLLPPAQGLVVVDGALNRGLDPDELRRAVEARAGRRGSARARTLLSLADDGPESPGESMTRFWVLLAGLPQPTTQVRVETRLGTFWADLGWEEWRLLLEYDGRIKYAATGPDSLVAEKRRHDALVEEGNTVLRVTKEDFRSVAGRVERAAPADLRRYLVPRPALAA